ncbi:hypothetical protein G7B40_018970 [Aetokthonos hydrillicola Thurmond2011]|uniref:Uncharacterized protein n=1 Tax=Aetokthonos hydrillicola Thurmond2011 TaxID=2712845 RepID=A0AAP5MBB3_9CYAN|nr:hypothetical protein [Aetokthonos hydrillicola]MBO3457860.1 hypothetical protein [Aetokthonos hydrillicola CCALA 1050]MBW4587346.1 hypothetical protein [Aetokthonos hydrillicola CCALA 1050]MDR9896629.1 hypothetical protein [Aetokthonos hydrillicola Thurmond2011]
MGATKTYVDQIDFWYWGELFTLSNLVDSSRHYCLELILKGKGKLECNKELQAKFDINKRWANSVYTEVQPIVTNTDENPAYSSLIGLTKFMSMYGMNSSSAAAFVIARRGRRFSERLPNKHHLLPSKSAYTEDTKVKHVWSHWSRVARSAKGTRRHQYFTARLNRTRKVTPSSQLVHSMSKYGLLGNPVQLELFEVGVIPTGNDVVSVAASKSRQKPSKRSMSTHTQLFLDLN